MISVLGGGIEYRERTKLKSQKFGRSKYYEYYKSDTIFFKNVQNKSRCVREATEKRYAL